MICTCNYSFNATAALFAPFFQIDGMKQESLGSEQNTKFLKRTLVSKVRQHQFLFSFSN